MVSRGVSGAWIIATPVHNLIPVSPTFSFLRVALIKTSLSRLFVILVFCEFPKILRRRTSLQVGELKKSASGLPEEALSLALLQGWSLLSLGFLWSFKLTSGSSLDPS
jgi:hypothetical protein